MPRCEIADTSYSGHAAQRLIVGKTEAIYLPQFGMLCASLRRDGEQLLGRTDELDAYLTKGSTIGIPFLHPWANRLDGLHYAVGSRSVDLDRHSAMLHLDEHGLPMHGVQGSKLAWTVVERAAHADRVVIVAELDWTATALLEIFPFPHRLRMTAALDEEGLTTSVVLESRGDVATPISFGFHPYLHLSGAPRDDWRLELPSLRRLRLDARRVPTGAEEEFSRRNDKLGDESFDDAFSVLDSKPRFVLQGLEQRLEVLFLEGYPYAQIYAPRERDFVAIEPMTAPANALVSGHGLRSVAPTKTFTASFRVQWN